MNNTQLNQIVKNTQTGDDWTPAMQTAWNENTTKNVKTDVLADKLRKMYAAIADVLDYTKCGLEDAVSILDERDETLCSEICDNKIAELFF